MRQTILARLERLERLKAESVSEGTGRYVRLWDREGASEEDLIAEAVAAGRAKPGDSFITYAFYRPGPNGPERVYVPEPEEFGA